MHGLEELVSLIYHEKQQPGSMLCAQHALNSLLQEHLFTAPDLSDIATGLDHDETIMDHDNSGTTSTNMDDTGFFSVQVLDKALEVWGLKLVRWRAQEMAQYQEHPYTQLAFILNSHQHWYTLRRFGDAKSDIDEDPGQGHWFNLNSFRSSPEWVSKTYLGMVLQQAETEGYSVFAVMQADPTAPLALTRTEADIIACTLPDPTSAARTTTHTGSSAQIRQSSGIEGFEDEDLELQAALQASLAGGTDATFVPNDPSPIRTTIWPSRSNSSSAAASGALTPLDSDLLDDDGDFDHSNDADADPIASTMRRNQSILQRMQAEQHMAQREIWQGEDQEQAPQRRRQEEEEEAMEAMLQRAIEESEAMAREHAAKQGDETSISGDGESSMPPSNRFPQPSSGYDDSDAELQAALKASLEQPHGAESTPFTNDEDMETEEPDNSSPAKSVDMEEMRRRRLEKFGG